MVREKSYQIVVTSPAQKRYQQTILNYLVEHFSIDRAIKIDQAITESISSLQTQPARGTKERHLTHLKQDFRFILHKESRNFELKIIYFLDESSKTVYITDFFPTLMNPKKMNQ